MLLSPFLHSSLFSIWNGGLYFLPPVVDTVLSDSRCGGRLLRFRLGDWLASPHNCSSYVEVVLRQLPISKCNTGEEEEEEEREKDEDEDEDGTGEGEENGAGAGEEEGERR